jgi:ElaB/YqjD/DUF883 family membrane-anchored ribosome-binding protein
MSTRKETGTAEEARIDLGQLKADFERLSENLSALRQHLVGFGLEGARGMVQGAGLAQLDALRRELDELSDDLRQQGRDALSQVERSVRERPLASLLMAFGVGMVLARLFGRRR